MKCPILLEKIEEKNNINFSTAELNRINRVVIINPLYSEYR